MKVQMPQLHYGSLFIVDGASLRGTAQHGDVYEALQSTVQGANPLATVALS